MALAEIGREEFIGSVWDARRGEHAIAVAPSGAGKTFLLNSLLEKQMARYPDLRVVYLMPKPADPSVKEWGDRLGLREIGEWPPKSKLFQRKPAGYLLWPPHAMNLDPDARRELVGATLRQAADDQYKAGNSITFLDDATSASATMHISSHVEELLTNGRAGNASVYLSAQRPAGTRTSVGVTTHAWANSTHLFMGSTPYDADIQRYSEISGLDPKVVEPAVRSLRTYRIGDSNVSDFLYVNKGGPWAAIVTPW